jgi:hypothetical protein
MTTRTFIGKISNGQIEVLLNRRPDAVGTLGATAPPTAPSAPPKAEQPKGA